MKRALEQLNKLRGRSFQEIRTRSRQELYKLADRLFIAHAGEMSDEALYAEFHANTRNGSGEGTSAMLRDRLRNGDRLFLPTLGERRAIVREMERRFPSERDIILKTADKAVAGRFDLLGYTDLDFRDPQTGGINWHLDPLTGARAPRTHWSRIDSVAPVGNGDRPGDLKVFWEISRTAHFVSLGQAYWLTGDHRYAEAFANQATHWIDNNPNGMGIGWAASLDVAFRAISWIWALHLCADSREITQEFVARLLKSLIEHGRHIEKYLSQYFSPNTHLTGEALGLFYLGVAFPELRRAKEWRRTGLRILLDQLPIHVRADGVYFEQASYYHRYTTDFYTHLFVLLRANEITLARPDEQRLWQKLEAMLDHLMWIARPDGSWPLFGDDDGGRLIRFAPRAGNDFRDTLAIGAAIFKRGDWKHVAGGAPSEVLWLLGSDAIACYDRVQAKPAAAVSRAFIHSGYFVMRDGWAPDSTYALIDCGRHGSELGAGHAHADALSIELAVQGTTWLVDPATYLYGVNPEARDYFRSTEAHNTVTVDGESQSVSADPFKWITTASCFLEEFAEDDETLIFEGWHDGYRRLSDPVTHSRTVLMLRRQAAFIVRDSFRASARHDYALCFHFAPGCELQTFGNRVEARHPSGAVLVLNFFAHGISDSSRTQARLEDGWVSTCYGQRSNAVIAVFEASAVGPMEFITVITHEGKTGPESVQPDHLSQDR